MQMTVTKTSMRVINGCLVVGVAAALLPQVLPQVGGVSAILTVASAAVAFGAYLFGQVPADEATREEKHRSENDCLPIPEHPTSQLTEEAVEASEVVFADFSEGVGDPAVWLSPMPSRALVKAHFRRRTVEPRAVQVMLYWYDEKNSNVHVVQTRKASRKVARSLGPFEDVPVLGSRLLH
jgi:hypothetical protein